MSKAEKAVEYKINGYNCCQSVLMTYKDEVDLSENQLMKIGAAFCTGMGCMEGTCGALIGAGIILGIKESDGRSIIKESRDLLLAFKEKCGATICKDLKGLDTGIVLCDCNSCVRNAILALEENLD